MDVIVDVDGDEDVSALEEALVEFLSGPAVVDAIAGAAYARWVELASERLTKSRDAYLSGLRAPVLTSDTGAMIALEGLFPNLVEDGMRPYDFRRTHLGGKDRRVIAFGQTAPGGGASASAEPFGYAYRGMGAGVARAVGRNITARAGRLAPGARLPQGAPSAGLQQRTRGAGSSSHLSFRTLSQDSPPGSWQHPGITARNLAGHVSEELDEIASRVVEAVITAMGG